MAGFADSIDEFRLDFIGGSEKAVRGTTIKLWSAIILATPVDSGRARSSWFATGKQPSVKVSVTTDKDGQKTVQDATNVVLGLKDFSTFTLTSNLVYMPSLEFGRYGDGEKTVGGYSRQAPRGMIRQNIRRFNRILEEEAKENLPK